MTRVSADGDERSAEAAEDQPPECGRLLTTEQVADLMQLSVAMIRKAIRDGRLTASLPAGRKHGYRIAPSAADDWLTHSRVDPKRRTGS